MDKKEYVKTCFDEAKRDMRTYFTSLNKDNTNFDEFNLMYDNISYSLQLWVLNREGNHMELNTWSNFNLTMFKQLVSLADRFSKESDKTFELWDVIPIKVSMRV